MKTIWSQLATMAEGRPSRPFAGPFLKYLLALVIAVLVYGWLFHVIMAWEGQDHTWFTGIYWALTVMSTLGFGDITFTTDVGRVFSTVVLLTGVMLLLIILPFLFIRYVYAPWLDERGKRRSEALRSVRPDVSGHVLICAHDTIAEGLVARLALAGIPAFIVEPNPEEATRLDDRGIPVVSGDLDSVETYRSARISEARLVLANDADTVNTSIVITAREVSDSVPIAALAEWEDSIDILELSGATEVLPLKRQLGEHLANRAAAGGARTNVVGHFHDLILGEFPVHNTPFQGKTLRDTRLREIAGISVIGVWERGRFHPPSPGLELTGKSVPLVVGTPEQLQELDEYLMIYDANPNPVVVIGGGKVGLAVTRALREREIPVHVVEKNPELAPEIEIEADEVFIGDAADRQILTRAGIEEAPSIVLSTHDDSMNIYLTVYCRRLNPEARILTRVNHDRNIASILRAGADFVLSYASLGVQTILSLVHDRELIVLGEGVDLFYIPLPEHLVGRSLASTGIGARTGLNVIAVEEGDETRTDLTPHQPLKAGCVLLAVGSTEQRRLFQTTYR